ncbi:hypothetical protein C8R42DRAFT_729823 [Lentinula raphanica]|nr:hypothetical protein C8R42DRAFT_729823 [Lentinula raphanica]
MASQSFKKFEPNVAILTLMIARVQRGEDHQAPYALPILNMLTSYATCPTYVKPLIQAVYEFGAELVKTKAKIDPEDLSCLQHIEAVMIKPGSDSSPLLVMQAGTYVNHFQCKLREITTEKLSQPLETRGSSLPSPQSQRISDLVQVEVKANQGPGKTRNNTDHNDNIPKSEIAHDNVKAGLRDPLMDSSVSSASVLEGNIPDLHLDPHPKSKTLPLWSQAKESIAGLKVKSKWLYLQLRHQPRAGSTQGRANSDSTSQHGQWSLGHITEASGGIRKHLNMLVSPRPTPPRP